MRWKAGKPGGREARKPNGTVGWEKLIFWWERFLTTVTDDGPTEMIAVENRSHNIFKLC